MANTQTLDGSGFKQDVHRLGESVGTIKTDVANLAHGAADAARSGVAELRQGAHHAIDAAKDKYQDAKECAADATDSLKHTIARHPLTSIGIAAGVGMLIGLIVFRPRS
jgi:ElaB/YqjD/DUF883 family membrane-anchored ribosome-binding protein